MAVLWAGKQTFNLEFTVTAGCIAANPRSISKANFARGVDVHRAIIIDELCIVAEIIWTAGRDKVQLSCRGELSGV